MSTDIISSIESIPLPAAVAQIRRPIKQKKEGTVSEETSLTVKAEALADEVIAGVKKIRTILDKVALLFKMFDDGERDSNNRLKVPIKGCHSKKEFCARHLDRNIRSIQLQLAAVNKDVNEEQKKGIVSEETSQTLAPAAKPEPKALPPSPVKDETKDANPAGQNPDGPQKITLKRKDGSTVPEATYVVADAVRHSVAFVLSVYRAMNADDKIKVIDGVIEKLRSERDFIKRDDTEAPKMKLEQKPSSKFSEPEPRKLDNPKHVETELAARTHCQMCENYMRLEDSWRAWKARKDAFKVAKGNKK